MQWHDDDDEDPTYEWVEEDENEVPEDSAKPLSKIGPIASAVFLILIVLLALFVLAKVFGALRSFFG